MKNAKHLTNIGNYSFSIKKRIAIFRFTILFASFFKLWLTGGLQYQAIPGDDIDQGLFARTAMSLLNGEWLGTYDYLTLSKGMFYPLFIAIAFLLNIPLLFAQQLLYIVACVLLIIAIKPIASHKVQLIIYLITVYLPFSYSQNIANTILRDYVATSLAVVIFSSTIAIFFRYKKSVKSLIPWAVSLGLSLSAFFLTREDGIWILPFIIVALTITAVFIIKFSKGHFEKKKKLLILILPLMLLILSNLAVAAINKIYYGKFITNDAVTPDFLRAYSAICRAKPIKYEKYVPVSNDSLKKMYDVSPSFNELRPYLESEKASWDRNANGGPFASYGFMWVLRQAVQSAGYYKNATTAKNFYIQLAKEINTACDEGKLPCYPKGIGVGQAPPWRNEFLPDTIISFQRGINYTYTFHGAESYPSYTIGNDKTGIELTENLTHQKAYIYPPFLYQRNIDSSGYSFAYKYNHKQMTVLHYIINIYGKIFPVIGVISCICFILVIVYRIICFFLKLKFKYRDEFIVTLGCVITYLLRLVQLSYIDATSFDSIRLQYLTTVYPFVIFMVFTSIIIFIKINIPIFKNLLKVILSETQNLYKLLIGKVLMRRIF